MKTKILLFYLLTLLFAFSQDLLPRPKFLPKSYKLVWHDEFDGEKIDESKWQFSFLGKIQSAINTNKNAHVKDGNLVITTTKKELQRYTSVLSTKETFQTTYGYFECRVKLQTQTGHYSKFWLNSDKIFSYPDNANLAGTQINIFEYNIKDNKFIGKSLVHHGIEWGSGALRQIRRTTSNHKNLNISDAWHTFGLFWTKDYYAFLVNGKVAWLVDDKKFISHVAQYIVLGLEITKWSGWGKFPDSLYIDYVRVYQK